MNKRPEQPGIERPVISTGELSKHLRGIFAACDQSSWSRAKWADYTEKYNAFDEAEADSVVILPPTARELPEHTERLLNASRALGHTVKVYWTDEDGSLKPAADLEFDWPSPIEDAEFKALIDAILGPDPLDLRPRNLE